MLGLVLAVLGRSALRQSASVVDALRAAAREALRAPAPPNVRLRRPWRGIDGGELRRRIAVEHSLATVHNRQADRARFWGLRKNLFDLRRHAALTNLSVLDQLQRAA